MIWRKKKEMKNKMLYLGIDIGGTSVKIGSVTEEGEIIEKDNYLVNYDNYETPILQTVIRSCKLFMNTYGRTVNSYKGIGVSATGAINTKTGIVDGSAGHIKNWEQSKIKEELEEIFGLPTYVLNDANAAALGELWRGAAQGKKQVVVITIGTGVGGGIIVNGEILLGANGFAGEIGHMPILYHGKKCSCGNSGCLEGYGSTTALVRMVKDAVEKGIILNEKNEEINGKWIFKEVSKQNQDVKIILEEWIEYISSGIVGLVHIFNPEQILIGGGVSEQKELFIDVLNQKVRSSVMNHFLNDFELKPAELGNDAGIIGAVYYCIQNK